MSSPVPSAERFTVTRKALPRLRSSLTVIIFFSRVASVLIVNSVSFPATSEGVPHAAAAVGALPEHATPLAATALHSSRLKRKAVVQSRALIKGMVGPYLGWGRRGLSNGISRSFRLKEKAHERVIRSATYSYQGRFTGKISPAFLKFTELLKENHLPKSQPLMRDSRLLGRNHLQSICRSGCLT